MERGSGARSATRRAWALAAYAFLGLSLAGIVLPLPPATPFALLAVYCAARGSERLHARLLAHPKLGPVIRDWGELCAVSCQEKLAATGTMAVSARVLLAVSGPGWPARATAAIMTVVATWLWLRPEPTCR